MITFVESLKRLYNSKKVNRDKLDEFKEKGKITQEEYDYITI